MATTTVGIVFEVFNRGAIGAKSIDTTLGNINRSLRGIQMAAGLVGLDLGLRGAVGAIKDVARAAMEAERSQNEFRVALDRTGDATAGNIAAGRAFAEQIESQTTYSDTQVLSQMAYAKTLGVTTDRLDETAIAAIGLASAYGMDLERATRAIALASEGELDSLKKVGIVIDKTASDRDRMNQVMELGTRGFVKARAAVDTTEGAMKQLENTWHSTKTALGTPFLAPMTEGFRSMTVLLRDNRSEITRWAADFKEGMSIVVADLGSVQRAMASETAQKPRIAFESMGPDMRSRVKEEYAKQTGETFGNWSQPFGFTGSKILPWPMRNAPTSLLLRRIEMGGPKDEAKLMEIIDTMQAANAGPRVEPPTTLGLPSADLMGGAAMAGAQDGGIGGLSVVTPAQEQAREQVDRLNQSLREQTTAAWLTARGHEHSAKAVQFESQVRQAYSGDLEKQNRLIEEYRATLNSLNVIEERDKRAEEQKQFKTELDLTISAMRGEAELAGLTNKEREKAAAVQNAMNEAQRRGVALTAAQRAELEKVVVELQRAKDLADMTFGEGWSLGIREMQEELLTTAQIAKDLSIQMRGGIVGALGDAVFRSQDLGKSLEQVLLKMTEYAVQEALWKPLVTQGMDIGTTFLKNLGGSLAGGSGNLFGGTANLSGPIGQTAEPGLTYNPVGSRLGNVFGTQGIIPFGRGTVIDRPTLFPFARGTGVMGEAGEEGILPLARDNAGRLGVHAGGGGNPAFGEMLAVLKQIAAKQMQINATIVDRRDLLHRKDMEGREGEQLVMYHAGRNQG
jgi:hypothetical protein